MELLIRSAEQRRFPNRTVRFEGADHGSPVSMFLVDNEPGEGSRLHVHPYAETWVVRAGEAEFTVGDRKLRATAGDIVVGPAQTPHRFENVGTRRLKLVCIHASARIIQEMVE
ncbi:MAG: cupin [Alphaproteobacteria bacterium]|nr:MAG: cupin [Alphaproteobacteria bacterium]